MMHTAQTMRLW